MAHGKRASTVAADETPRQTAVRLINARVAKVAAGLRQIAGMGKHGKQLKPEEIDVLEKGMAKLVSDAFAPMRGKDVPADAPQLAA